MMEAALQDPVGCAHNAVTRSGVKPDQSALVVGGGPLGLFSVHYLKTLGIKNIILSEPVARRAELGSEFGADVVLNPNEVDIDAEVKKLTDGLGPEVLIEAVGVPKTTLESASLVRSGGKIVWLGVCMEEIAFRPVFWNLKSLSIELIMGSGGADAAAGQLQFIQERQDEVRKAITEIITLDGVPDAFERLLNPNTEMKVMVEFD
jgi:threonine dehydrogenase-like Zn-dependent dehydrogenase